MLSVLTAAWHLATLGVQEMWRGCCAKSVGAKAGLPKLSRPSVFVGRFGNALEQPKGYWLGLGSGKPGSQGRRSLWDQKGKRP